MNWVIQSIDPRHASDDEYRAVNIFSNALRAERLPDDPPISLAEQIQEFRNIPPFIQVSAWIAMPPGEARTIASGHIALRLTEDNQHVAEAMIEVLPAFRRQGIARELLARIVEVAQASKRTLLIGTTTERIPAGEAWMKRLGAERGMEGHTNQLKLADVDRALLQRWQAQARERAANFELGFWDGLYPEEDLAGIVSLWQVMNTAPRGNLQIEDFQMTPAIIRAQEKSMLARGTQRWTMYVREKTTGKFAGYTEVFWNPHRPEILQQAATAVFPEYRNHGLGRWLKAAMLDHVLRERPQVKFIRTDNADMNAPMLKINHALGFQPYISQTTWQVTTDKVREYLKA